MNRQSKIITEHDDAGKYEVESFDCINPRNVIVCSHGNGVRRWDGERFFYNVAEHYPKDVVFLVDQNQPYEDGCKLNSLSIMVSRVQKLVNRAASNYPSVPIIVMGHSMGCGVASQLDLNKVAKLIFVAPGAGKQIASYTDRYGKDVLNGKIVRTGDGLTKYITKEFVDSVRDITWEIEYRKLLTRYKPVYVFESGDEEIVGDERLEHRSMPFADYKIIHGATHNLHGEALQKFYAELNNLL